MKTTKGVFTLSNIDTNMGTAAFKQSILFSLFLVAIPNLACEDESGLTKVCPQPIPCAVATDGTILTENLEQYSKGECALGTLDCNEKSEEYCKDYVAPVEEVCDGKDNDCNGKVDDGFDADGDGYASCNDCNDRDEFVNPGAPERCNNRDDNCNELIDEQLERECWTGAISAKFEAPSLCKKGLESCVAGSWTSCQGQTLPATEICDGSDNDCDGEVDEKVENACGPTLSIGACRRGDLVCQDYEQVCVGASYPGGELCDGVDNDCDGVVDNDLYRPCNTACGVGYEICSSGGWIDCNAPQPRTELCDGVDNDCDGQLDEGCPCILNQTKICRNGIIDSDGNPMTCGFGISICDAAGNWGDCHFFGVEQERCNNWDDDCDGDIDGINQVCGNPNYAGVGQCRMGEQLCLAGQWGICEGEVLPQTEICDQIDNDCDGYIDENLNPHNKVDMIFAIDISGSMTSSINALVQGIATYISDFVGTRHKFGIVTFPGPNNPQTPMTVRTVPPLLSASAFQAMLGNITANGGGSEPSYDVLYHLADPLDPMGIGWRSDAFPYIILITDEHAQTWTNIKEPEVAQRTVNCGIGDCKPGDRIEVYIITLTQYASMWNDITYNDPNRIISINPADAARYTQFFRDIFQNVCI